MAAGVSDRLWEIYDAAPKPGKRGTYKKRISN